MDRLTEYSTSLESLNFHFSCSIRLAKAILSLELYLLSDGPIKYSNKCECRSVNLVVETESPWDLHQTVHLALLIQFSPPPCADEEHPGEILTLRCE